MVVCWCHECRGVKFSTGMYVLIVVKTHVGGWAGAMTCAPVLFPPSVNLLSRRNLRRAKIEAAAAAVAAVGSVAGVAPMTVFGVRKPLCSVVRRSNMALLPPGLAPHTREAAVAADTGGGVCRDAV